MLGIDPKRITALGSDPLRGDTIGIDGVNPYLHLPLDERIHEKPGFLLFQNPMQLRSRGLLRARSKFPEIIENIENRKQRMERLD